VRQGRRIVFDLEQVAFRHPLDQRPEEFRLNIQPRAEHTAINLGLGAFEFLAGETQQLDKLQRRPHQMKKINNQG
jgi:hypothetical protein